jgi:predicted nucleic acid-binding protein
MPVVLSSDKIDSLPLLQSLFKTISTSIEVAEEFGKPLPEWVQIKAVQDKNFQSALFLQVDAGEASAIALAAENQPSLLIIDDLKGRRLAQKLNLNFTGTLGLILTAKKEGILPQIKPLFQLRTKYFDYFKAFVDNVRLISRDYAVNCLRI